MPGEEQQLSAIEARDALIAAFEREFLRRVSARVRTLDVHDHLEATRLFLSFVQRQELTAAELQDELGWSLASLLGTTLEETVSVLDCYREFLRHWPRRIADSTDTDAGGGSSGLEDDASRPPRDAARCQGIRGTHPLAESLPHGGHWGGPREGGDAEREQFTDAADASVGSEMPAEGGGLGRRLLIVPRWLFRLPGRVWRPWWMTTGLLLVILLLMGGGRLRSRLISQQEQTLQEPLRKTTSELEITTPAPSRTSFAKVLDDPENPPRPLDPSRSPEAAARGLPTRMWIVAFATFLLAFRPWFSPNAAARARQARELARRQREVLDEPVGNEEIEASVPPQPHIEGTALDEAATLLARLSRATGEGLEIHIERSVRETIHRGVVTPLLIDHREQRELLFLIDVERVHDDQGWPWLAGFEATLDHLEAHGVALVRLYFSTDPGQVLRRSRPMVPYEEATASWTGLVGRRYAFGGAIPFEQAARPYAGSPLIVFSRDLAQPFLYNRSGWERWLRILDAAWPLRAWIDPSVEDVELTEPMAGFRAAMGHADIPRFPWSERGILSLASFLSLEGHGPAPEPDPLPAWPDLTPQQQRAVKLWALASVQRPDARWSLLQYLRAHPDLPELSRVLRSPRHLHWLLQYARELQPHRSMDRGPRLNLSRVWGKLAAEGSALVAIAPEPSPPGRGQVVSSDGTALSWHRRFGARLRLFHSAGLLRRDFVGRVNSVMEERLAESLEALEGRGVPRLLLEHARLKLAVYRARQAPQMWGRVAAFLQGPVRDEAQVLLEWQMAADADRMPDSWRPWVMTALGKREGGSLRDYFSPAWRPWLASAFLALVFTGLLTSFTWSAMRIEWLQPYLPAVSSSTIARWAPQDKRVYDPLVSATPLPEPVQPPIIESTGHDKRVDDLLVSATPLPERVQPPPFIEWTDHILAPNLEPDLAPNRSDADAGSDAPSPAPEPLHVAKAASVDGPLVSLTPPPEPVPPPPYIETTGHGLSPIWTLNIDPNRSGVNAGSDAPSPTPEPLRVTKASIPATEKRTLPPGRRLADPNGGRYRPALLEIPFPKEGFLMGAPEWDKADDLLIVYNDERPQHRVTFNHRFALFEAEISQGRYEALMRATEEQDGARKGVDPHPWASQGHKTVPDQPAIYIDWFDAAEYANRLSRLEGLETCYTGAPPDVRLTSLHCKGYRLPTEAEWEYAARAGTRNRWAGTNDDATVCEFANIRSCVGGSALRAVQVGRNQNGWGLYDMSGNVWEWVGDWYGLDYYKNAPGEDRGGPTSGARRVVRSGSWFDYPRDARVSHRSMGSPDYRFVHVGFRLSRSLR